MAFSKSSLESVGVVSAPLMIGAVMPVSRIRTLGECCRTTLAIIALNMGPIAEPRMIKDRNSRYRRDHRNRSPLQSHLAQYLAILSRVYLRTPNCTSCCGGYCPFHRQNAQLQRAAGVDEKRHSVLLRPVDCEQTDTCAHPTRTPREFVRILAQNLGQSKAKCPQTHSFYRAIGRSPSVVSLAP